MEKKATTKNQHYVPQFYQRNFSVDGKTIGAYILGQDKYVPNAAIKHQASSDYFYSSNMKVEEALGGLESLASKAIEEIKKEPRDKMQGEDQMALFVYTMLQIGRTPAFVKMMMDNANKMGTMMFRKYVEAKRKTEQAHEVELITDNVLDALSIEMKEPALHAIGTISKILDVCYDLLKDPKILINKTGKSFITSDNPACMYDQHFERIGGLSYALGTCGLQIYLPLNATLAIMYYDRDCYKLGDRRKTYVELMQEHDVEQLNRLVACTADEVLYCEKGRSSDDDLQRYAKIHSKYHISDPVQTFDSFKSGSSEIFGVSSQPMFCKLELSFVKELPCYKARTASYYGYFANRYRKLAYLRQRFNQK